MKFKKLGLIAKPDTTKEWQQSHMQCPRLLKLEEEGQYRMFYASRDKNQRAQIGFADIDLTTLKIYNIQNDPVVKIGNLGNFDSGGVYPLTIMKYNNQYLLYYTSRYNNDINGVYIPGAGLAISDNCTDFVKYSSYKPIGLNEEDQVGTSTPSIFYFKNKYHGVYFGLEKFYYKENKINAEYKLKTANMENLKHPIFTSNLSIKPQKQEFPFSFIVTKDKVHAWNSYVDYNNKPYVLSYSISTDGVNFERRDDLLEIEKGKEGEFDSEMMCYPCVVEHNNKLYMFYNGNKNGRDGIGLAVCEDYTL